MESRRVSVAGVVASTVGSLTAASVVLLSTTIAFANPGGPGPSGEWKLERAPGQSSSDAPGSFRTDDLDLPVMNPRDVQRDGDDPLNPFDRGDVDDLDGEKPKPAPGQPSDQDPASDPSDEPPPTFFGEEISTRGESIIYVIDHSGSMSIMAEPFVDEGGAVVENGSRLDRAKAELRRSISALPASFSFNVIFFDECTSNCWNEKQRATAENKANAFAWIDAVQPDGWTNTALATTTALGDKQNTSVVLLSDGSPNFMDCAMNYVGSYEQHRTLIASQNTQGARINTFGFGVQSDPDARAFMQAVAADSGGTYVEVN